MKVFDHSDTKRISKVAEQILRKDVTAKMRDCARILTLAACYVLHTKYGFGTKRLQLFVNDFKPTLEQLLDRYEMNVNDDGEWLMAKKLSEDGIPIDKIIGDGMITFNYTLTK